MGGDSRFGTAGAAFVSAALGHADLPGYPTRAIIRSVGR